MKGFGCLGAVPSESRPPIDTDKNESKSTTTTPATSTNGYIKKHKSVPPTPRNSIIVPSLSSASKSLLTTKQVMIGTSFINQEYEFVFRSRPIESCQYEPYKILVFIASAQGYHHTNNVDMECIEDPQLSSDGVSQCKIVSAALRKAKQSRPDIMYCSSMYRALSTMQLVCPDWYDDVKCIALDQLRPRSGKYPTNKRSNTHQLQDAFKKVSFQHVPNDKDQLWTANELESEDNLAQRTHQFLTKFLIPKSELLRSQYGTLKTSKLENIGWNSSKTNSPYNSSSSQSPSPNIINNAAPSFKRRVVVISHREFFSYLMKNIIQDISPQLCREWKHCDLRKVFVYTKQQLGIEDIPCYTLSNGQYYSPNNQSRVSRKNIKNIKNNNNKYRSKTPNEYKKNKHHQKSHSMHFRSSSSSKYDGNIRTTSNGDILMTNDKLFGSHKFTLTTMSAALLNEQKGQKSTVAPLPMITSRSVDALKVKNKQNASSSLSTISSTDSDSDSDDDDDEEIQILKPGDLLKEDEKTESPYIPNINPLISYSKSHKNQNIKSKSSSSPPLMFKDNKSENMIKSKRRKHHIIIVTPPPSNNNNNNNNNIFNNNFKQNITMNNNDNID